jgi:hypothetical protein
MVARLTKKISGSRATSGGLAASAPKRVGPLHDQEGADLCTREENAGYRIGEPDSVRAITRRWISLVPSKIV